MYIIARRSAPGPLSCARKGRDWDWRVVGLGSMRFIVRMLGGDSNPTVMLY